MVTDVGDLAEVSSPTPFRRHANKIDPGKDRAKKAVHQLSIFWVLVRLGLCQRRNRPLIIEPYETQEHACPST